MAVKIKLIRLGKRDKAFYRIVVAEEGTKRTGKAIQNLGYYDPSVKPAKIKLDEQALKNWMSKGAQPTDGVKKLLK